LREAAMSARMVTRSGDHYVEGLPETATVVVRVADRIKVVVEKDISDNQISLTIVRGESKRPIVVYDENGEELLNL
jgi:hypothetical protein